MGSLYEISYFLFYLFFFFQGSASLWQEYPKAMGAATALHNALIKCLSLFPFSFHLFIYSYFSFFLFRHIAHEFNGYEMKVCACMCVNVCLCLMHINDFIFSGKETRTLLFLEKSQKQLNFVRRYFFCFILLP